MEKVISKVHFMNADMDHEHALFRSLPQIYCNKNFHSRIINLSFGFRLVTKGHISFAWLTCQNWRKVSQIKKNPFPNCQHRKQ